MRIYDHSPISYHFDASNLTLSTWWYKVKVRQAFSYWEEVGPSTLGYTPRFVPTDDKANADIVLWFRDDTNVGPTCGNSTTALGCARLETLDPKFSIEIKTRREGDAKHYSYGLIGDVTKHEMGHALGLGHSPDPRSIMYESTDTTRYADAQPIDSPWPILAGIGALLMLILGSIIVILRVTRAPPEDEQDEAAPTPTSPEAPRPPPPPDG